MENFTKVTLAEALRSLQAGKKIAEYNWDGYQYVHLVNGELKDENNNPIGWEIITEDDADLYIVGNYEKL